MNPMTTAKKAVKKAVKAIKKALEPVEKGSAEWLAQKAEAKKRLDNL